MGLSNPKSRRLRGPAKNFVPPPLSDKETAAYQRRTRHQHAQERAQDYVEAIADLISVQWRSSRDRPRAIAWA